MSVTEMVPISVLPAPETTGRAAVYRIFGDEQRLLYIGSSERPRQRWHEHRNRTTWWPEARAYSLTWLPTREAAYEAESSAIKAERPVFNQVWQQISAPRKEPESVEEAQRVFDALDEVEAMADELARARVIGRLLKDQASRSKRFHDYRRKVVLELRAQTPPVPYRKIAAELGVSLGTVQDIERGAGRWDKRPKKTTEESTDG